MAAPAMGRRPGSVGSMSGAERQGSAKGTVRLPPMGCGTAPWPKLATFDWPPPPSPAVAVLPTASSPGLASGLGDTAPPAAPAQKEAKPLAKVEGPGRSERPKENRLRQELWAVRSQIERHKVRTVAPQPFFGNPMRFQDEHSALQITEDGRFSFSSVDPEADVPGHVVSYEGVFGTSELDDPMLGEQGVAAKTDPEVALIEGRALVRHEFVESGGKSRVVKVEPGLFRFAITVSPFFQPKDATVQSLARPLSPGRPPARCRRLQYVGTGAGSPSRHGRESRSLSARKRAQQAGFTLKRGPGLKFSRSCAATTCAANTGSFGSSNGFGGGVGADRTAKYSGSGTIHLPKLVSSSSAPQLQSMQHTLPKESKSMSVAEWKEFYQHRAQMVFEQRAKY